MSLDYTTEELRAMGYQLVGGKLVRAYDCRAVDVGSGDRPLTDKLAGLHPPSASPDPARPQFKSKAEQSYANRLTSLQRVGSIKLWRYEDVTLRLGDRVRYTPDFFVELWDGSMEFHEVKGKHTWEQARVKLKVAASRYQRFRFLLVRIVGGRFDVTDIRTLSGGMG